MEKTEDRPTQEPDTTAAHHEGEEEEGGMQGEEEGEGDAIKIEVVRRKRRVKGEKVCGVCGDTAMSHNFGALTCETCKAFFRRNAHRQKEMPACVFQNNCTITKTTRRFCAACRLKKCFDIGMTSDLILDEEEKRARKKQKTAGQAKDHITLSAAVSPHSAGLQQPPLSQVLGQTSHILHQTSQLHSHTSQLSQESSLVHPQSSYLHHQASPIPQGQGASGQQQGTADYVHVVVCQNNVHLSQPAPLHGRLSPISAAINTFYDTIDHGALAHGTGHSGQFPMQHTACAALETVPSACAQSGNTNTQSSTVIAHGQSHAHESPPWPLRCMGTEFPHVAREELPWDIKLYWPLTSDERQVLMKLSSAYQDIMMTLVPEEGEAQRRGREERGIMTEDVLFALDYSLRKCVRFSKAIPEFHQLQQTDQISTLKTAAMQLTTIRASAFYVPERRLWLTIYGDASVPDILQLFGNDPAVAQFTLYCEALKSVVKNDSTLYALLHAISLFDPRDDTLQDRALVNKLKDRYIILLKHHLEAQFSFLHADRYLAELMNHLVDLRQLGHNAMVFYKQYSHLFKPLLTEIFSK